jgi:glutathione S-transferase
MPDELVFHTHPSSRGRIARWMLEESGAPYRTEIVAFGAPMKSPEYRAINPMGKVPALVDRGTVITECAAICAYLADAYPQAGLSPTPGERGSYYRWLFFAAGPFEAAVTDRARGLEPTPEQRPMVGYGHYDDVVATLEQWLGSQPYAAGERFTAADVYLGAQVAWALQFGSIESRPAFVDYAARVTAREAYERAKTKDDAAMKSGRG